MNAERSAFGISNWCRADLRFAANQMTTAALRGTVSESVSLVSDPLTGRLPGEPW